MTYKLCVLDPNESGSGMVEFVLDVEVDSDDESLLTYVAAGHLYHRQYVEVMHALYEWESGQFVFAYNEHGQVISEAVFRAEENERRRLNEEDDDAR